MPRTATSRWVFFGLLGLLLAAAGTAVAQDRADDGDRGRGRRGAAARWLRKGAVARRAEGMQRIRRLMDASDDQVRVALEASREAARARGEAKAKAAEIVVQAFREAKDAAPERRSQIRAETREKLRALWDGAREPITEAGKKVLAVLTPGQRKKMDGALKDRGLTFDDDRIALSFGMRLAHPWAEALLRARLGK